MKLFQQPTFNHTPHILASVFLCGLWLPMWLLMAATFNPPYRCSFCGYTDQIKYLMNPGLRQAESDHQRRQLVEAERRRGVYRDQLAASGQNRNYVGEWWATRSQNQRLGLIGGTVALILVGVGASIAALVSAPLSTSQATPTAQSVPGDVLVSRRRGFADLSSQTFRPNNVSARVEGSNSDVLTFEGKGVNAKFVEWFKSSSNFQNAKDMKFSRIVFSNGKFNQTLFP